MPKQIHIVTGTTAVGKTEWTLALAEKLDAEIISCDASCLYRGMDIGTAKPSLEERARIPHHLIDVAPITETFDVVRYAEAARSAVESISKRGKAIIIAGGSGFYLKSFYEPIADNISVSAAIRSKVRQLSAQAGIVGLQAALKQCSPGDWGNLDPENPRRLERALERCWATGKPLVEIQADFAALPKPFPDFEKHLTVLERTREDLEQRIVRRVTVMLNNGLIEEVSTLRAQGIEQNPMAASAIGYREVLAHLNGELALEALSEAIAANTRKLAAKQRKWIRRQLPQADERIHFTP